MSSLGPAIGLLLSRLIVPAWVLSGAIFKLLEATPKNLPPKTILALGDKLGLNLFLLLATLIGVEFLAAAVMFLCARLARPVAIFMLSVFCLVLIGEIVQGNGTSCGCLGKITMPPWLMLAIDGSMLLGVMAFDPSPIYPAVTRRWPVGVAFLVGIAGAVWSFVTILPAANASEPIVDAPHVNTADNANPAPKPVPPYWLSSKLESWVGMPWRQVPLFQFMSTWPRDLDKGIHYVVFYNRTCDHCQDMFEMDLTDPSLGRMVTAVEVPDGRDLMTSPSAWFMPQTECEMLALPLRCEWIITTPLTLRIEDGVVTCAEEGDHKKCMGLE